MAKLEFPLAPVDSELPRPKGGFYISRGKRGTWASIWPRKRPPATHGVRLYREWEFQAANQIVQHVHIYERQSAATLTKGTTRTWHDALMSSVFGNCFYIYWPDGTVWRPYRDIMPTLQEIFTELGGTPGCMIFMSDLGWVVLEPAAEAAVLTVMNGMPAWNTHPWQPTFNELGTLTGPTILDYSLGDYHHGEQQADVNFTFANWPASGTVGKLTLDLESNGPWAYSWPSNVLWTDAEPPDPMPNSRNMYVFTTIDGGVTILGSIAGQDYA
jgi:hypothetical protein